MLGDALLRLRRYDEADRAFAAALTVGPSPLSAVQDEAMVFLARGNLDGARTVLNQPPAGVDLPTFVAYMATYQDLYWALDADQRALVTRLRPDALDGDAGGWGLTLAGVYEMAGDRRRAAAYGDSARAAFEQQLSAAPEDALTRVLLGMALARIYIMTGEPEKAPDRLEALLKQPYYLSPGWLRIDPTFDPLRSNPRFKKLVEATA